MAKLIFLLSCLLIKQYCFQPTLTINLISFTSSVKLVKFEKILRRVSAPSSGQVEFVVLIF